VWYRQQLRVLRIVRSFTGAAALSVSTRPALFLAVLLRICVITTRKDGVAPVIQLLKTCHVSML
jgi:hypothetical protein